MPLAAVHEAFDADTALDWCIERFLAGLCLIMYLELSVFALVNVGT